jgi:hypothetical protein
VIVLDRDLPGMHGDEICAELVAAGSRSRLLMLTAAGTMDDVVDGLELGADDYLPKPFDFPVLVARIGALLRRAQPAIPPVLRSGDLIVDSSQRRGYRGERELDLSPKEFAPHPTPVDRAFHGRQGRMQLIATTARAVGRWPPAEAEGHRPGSGRSSRRSPAQHPRKGAR